MKSVPKTGWKMLSLRYVHSHVSVLGMEIKNAVWSRPTLIKRPVAVLTLVCLSLIHI